MFNAECLLEASSMKALMEPLYAYLPRPDGLMNTNNDISKILKNKYDFLRERERLGKTYEAKTGREAIDLFGGSLIMSVFQLAACLEGPGAYTHYRQYLSQPSVQLAIKKAPLHYKNLKGAVPAVMLKLRMDNLLFAMLRLATRLGIKSSF